MKRSAPSSAVGTASITIKGSMKLSYCARQHEENEDNSEREDKTRSGPAAI